MYTSTVQKNTSYIRKVVLFFIIRKYDWRTSLTKRKIMEKIFHDTVYIKNLLAILIMKNKTPLL